MAEPESPVQPEEIAPEQAKPRDRLNVHEMMRTIRERIQRGDFADTENPGNMMACVGPWRGPRRIPAAEFGRPFVPEEER